MVRSVFTEPQGLGHPSARKVSTRCSQHENLLRARWISAVQIQVAEHAALCRDDPHKTRPAASDALGGILDCLNPPLMLWSVRDGAAKPQ